MATDSDEFQRTIIHGHPGAEGDLILDVYPDKVVVCAVNIDLVITVPLTHEAADALEANLEDADAHDQSLH